MSYLGDVNATPKKGLGRSPVPDHKSYKSKFKKKTGKHQQGSVTDESEDESLESEQTPDSMESKSNSSKQTKNRRKNRDTFEILEGLKDGQRCEDRPQKYEGFLMKRRKWPMKGWHKRYFLLENGFLLYAKSLNDIQKGKIHGSMDIGLSVISFKRDMGRIDIDAEETIYHLKMLRANKKSKIVDEWLDKFRHHRLYRQHEIAYGSNDAPKLTDVSTPVEELTPRTSPVSPSINPERRGGSFKRSREMSQNKVAAWLLDTAGIEQCNKDLSKAQAAIYELSEILEKLYKCSLVNHTQAPDSMFEASLSSSFNASSGPQESGPPTNLAASINAPGGSLLTAPPPIHVSSSNPNLLTNYEKERARPNSMPDYWMSGGLDPKLQETKLREDFLNTAKTTHETLRSLSRTISTERERLKCALEQESGASPVMGGSAAYVQSLKNSLADALKQNAELRNRIVRIHTESNLSSLQQPAPLEVLVSAMGGDPSQQKSMFNGNLNPVSPVLKNVAFSPFSPIFFTPREHPVLTNTASWETASVSEFYDAAEHLSSETSEVSDEEEMSSDISDTENTAAPSLEDTLQIQNLPTGRRSKLPCPRPQMDISLWSLLCKNIGKDLSQISMPVTLNEPLNMLQKLCEELEYSELLDRASETDDPYERMILIAAFTVSPYAATYYRCGQKPFNPLLGETYECIREDKGWRFVSEQVSHHPPISACYAHSRNFVFYQDVRIKTKFWGKSMEILPIGTVHLKLPAHKDHYKWNKVTTCVHNILGGQRYVDHYGECIIKNETYGITCKLTYTKGSYWSDKRHDVYGTITGPQGKVHNIFGKWNEGIWVGHNVSAKCIWRPGTMPEDHELYYGFTRFAIELNEIDQEQVHQYPPTDTRFRPDQRLLEEGKIQEAENEKLRMEQFQRERRKQREEENVQYSARWFMRDEESGKETFRYSGKYWDMRKDPSFIKMQFVDLW